MCRASPAPASSRLGSDRKSANVSAYRRLLLPLVLRHSFPLCTVQDYTQFFRNIAVGQTLVDGLAVLKGALCHYDIFATAGTSFGNALVREFDLPPISRATNEAALDALEGQRSSQVEMTDEEIKGLLLGKQFKEELDAQEKLWKVRIVHDRHGLIVQDPGKCIGMCIPSHVRAADNEQQIGSPSVWPFSLSGHACVCF